MAISSGSSSFAGKAATRVRLTEIFLSIQGEADSVGWPTVFVRLTGCPLRCSYCDTAYAFHGGEWFRIEAVLEKVASFDTRHVCVTGGEPLAQKGCLVLLQRLCDAGHQVSLETSGAMDVSTVDPRVVRVVDIKTPGSGEVARNRYENLALLRPEEQIKFVICNRADFEWACEQVRTRHLQERCMVLFSPSSGQVEAGELAQWILDARLPVRLQVQLHKYLWGDTPGR
ncbi:7-carboxy-7-deazaguanine synthase [Steroidobacter denitrificans]|uniref:7-carboxy-7-deazaguanine synthase n=1 Tax=Steroidobacter denitrificans TaxID=465721 RepID=A0A127FC33_STEDE|nr:7-carboxy-7-deazaguanine synthase QueE [Steroidobacter denitrificans]AMN47149.1 7-carboxy-7-deazaguanine synthase [Steroidobacter denitrificans]